MAVGDAELLQRKYDQQASQIESENALRSAQATGITGALDSENAVRTAQAKELTQQGNTLQPLADASIQHTTLGEIPLEQAQTGLFGAQQRDVDFGQQVAHPLARLNYLNQMTQSPGFGLGGGRVAGPAELGGPPVGSSNGAYNAPDPNDPNNKITSIGAAGGATDVQSPTTKKAPAAPQAEMGQGPMAVMSALPGMHEIMAHAMNSLHAAGGATTVLPLPAPGQTQTSGTWTPPGANPPSGQNQDLRAKMGFGIKAAGGATNVQAQKGTTQVPGNGPANVDSVPATLAPQEAVLNAGAAHTIGRGAIALLNAHGAAKMAAAGMPPATPPTAHGVAAPARGAPASAKGKGPPARGAPAPGKGNPFGKGKPPAAKAPMAKPAPVAAKGGGK